jgi:RHS repeat-associated protein
VHILTQATSLSYRICSLSSLVLFEPLQISWPSKTRFSAKLSWLVTDHLGTPRIVVDKTGGLSGVGRHDYLPFGEDLSVGRTTTPGYATGDNVRQKFTSKERDNEARVDYFLARYYAADQGRFESADSYFGGATKPQTLNLYTYVRNNPLKYVDPTGHADEGAQKQGKKGLPEGDEGHYDPASDMQVYEMPAGPCNCPDPPKKTGAQSQNNSGPDNESQTGFGWGIVGGGHAFAGIGMAGGGGTGGAFMGNFSGRNGLVNGAGLQGGALVYGLAGARAARPRLIESFPEIDDDESAAVVGASAGYGGGLFFTNAGTPEQLRGPFETTQINTPWVGIQYDRSGLIKVVSVTFGPTVGVSYFHGKTGAVTTPSLPSAPWGGTIVQPWRPTYLKP